MTIETITFGAPHLAVFITIAVGALLLFAVIYVGSRKPMPEPDDEYWCDGMCCPECGAARLAVYTYQLPFVECLRCGTPVSEWEHGLVRFDVVDDKPLYEFKPYDET